MGRREAVPCGRCGARSAPGAQTAPCARNAQLGPPERGLKQCVSPCGTLRCGCSGSLALRDASARHRPAAALPVPLPSEARAMVTCRRPRRRASRATRATVYAQREPGPDAGTVPATTAGETRRSAQSSGADFSVLARQRGARAEAARWPPHKQPAQQRRQGGKALPATRANGTG